MTVVGRSRPNRSRTPVPPPAIAPRFRSHPVLLAHGAVEQTFVPFYRTLIPVAAKHESLKRHP